MARDSRFIKGENLVLSGVTSKYAHTVAPDTKYEHKWCVRAYLNEADATGMKELGFNIKDSDEGPFIQLNRKCITRAGKKMSPPQVVDRNRELFTEEIGNGSIINVAIWAKYVTVSGNEKLCAYLEKIQVVDHIPAQGGGGDFDIIE